MNVLRSRHLQSSTPVNVVKSVIGAIREIYTNYSESHKDSLVQFSLRLKERPHGGDRA